MSSGLLTSTLYKTCSEIQHSRIDFYAQIDILAVSTYMSHLINLPKNDPKNTEIHLHMVIVLQPNY